MIINVIFMFEETEIHQDLAIDSSMYEAVVETRKNAINESNTYSGYIISTLSNQRQQREKMDHKPLSY